MSSFLLLGLRGKRMDARSVTYAYLFLAMLLLCQMCPVASSEEARNRALADVACNWMCYTDEDSVGNVPMTWGKNWYFRIVNIADESHEALSNPMITVETGLKLIWLHPSPILSGPPRYQWAYEGEVPEGYWFLAGGFEEEEMTDRPRFSASRAVSPERLTGIETNQTVVATFRLEEPLPLEVNEVAVTIGFYPIVSPHPLVPTLVDYTVLEYIIPDNWMVFPHGKSGVEWYTFNVSAIELGKTYEFRATVQALKSEHLEGSPISKPSVGVIWRRIDMGEAGVSGSVTIDYPDGVKATFESGDELEWRTFISSSYHSFGFVPIVTKVVGTEPLFHTLSNLIFTLHSNADLHIYDPAERHVGLNYDTNEIETQIPGSTYKVIEESQVITVPEPISGDYKVVLVGTSPGPYRLVIDEAADRKIFFTESRSGWIEKEEIQETMVKVPETVGLVEISAPPVTATTKTVTETMIKTQPPVTSTQTEFKTQTVTRELTTTEIQQMTSTETKFLTQTATETVEILESIGPLPLRPTFYVVTVLLGFAVAALVYLRFSRRTGANTAS